jgi:crotonobetaine/carnitine-CoA ligase
VPPTPEEIVDFCGGKMAYYAIPRYVEFVEVLPKAETQRIQYGILRQRGNTEATWDRQQAGHVVERR